MATPTYTLIDSVTLGTSASSVTFSSISATGKGDLVLTMEFKGSGGNAYGALRFNGDTGSNYSTTFALGDGSAPGQGGGTSDKIAVFAATTTSSYLEQYQIMDYSATDKHKSLLRRGNRADYRVDMLAGRWANTAAITSIEIFALTNSYAAGSTFHLYQLVSE